MKIKAIDLLADSYLPIDTNIDLHINNDRLFSFPFENIPVISDNKLLGYVHKNIFKENFSIEKIQENLICYDKHDLINSEDHLFNIVNQIVNHKNKFLVVTDEDEEYLGIIEAESIFDQLGSFSTFSSAGTLLMLEVSIWNYSFHQISGIIESENTKILGILIDDKNVEDNKLKIILKIESNNVERIIASFERYGYDITSYLETEKISNKKLKEHFDALMHYLNV